MTTPITAVSSYSSVSAYEDTAGVNQWAEVSSGDIGSTILLNRIRNSILATQKKLGLTPEGSFTTVQERFENISYTKSSILTINKDSSTSVFGENDFLRFNLIFDNSQFSSLGYNNDLNYFYGSLAGVHSDWLISSNLYFSDGSGGIGNYIASNPTDGSLTFYGAIIRVNSVELQGGVGYFSGRVGIGVSSLPTTGAMFHVDGGIQLVNTTSNLIDFGTTGVGFNSAGAKIRIYGSGVWSNSHYGMGIQSGYTWYNSGGTGHLFTINGTTYGTLTSSGLEINGYLKESSSRVLIPSRLTAGTNVTITSNDATGEATIDSIGLPILISFSRVRANSGVFDSYGWTMNALGTSLGSSDTNEYPFILYNATPASAGSGAGWAPSTDTWRFGFLGTFEAVIKLSSDITNTRIWAGMKDGAGFVSSDTPADNLCAFRYSSIADGGSGKWSAYTSNSGGNTVTTTSVNATVSTVYRMKIVCTSSDIKFYIDGVLVATHTTNLPLASAVCKPVTVAYNTTASSRSIAISSVTVYKP